MRIHKMQERGAWRMQDVVDLVQKAAKDRWPKDEKLWLLKVKRVDELGPFVPWNAKIECREKKS